MRLSIVEKQDVLNFVNIHHPELIDFIGPDAEEAHREDGFIEVTLIASLIMSLVTSLGNISDAVMSIDDLLKRAIGLIRWWKNSSKDSGPEAGTATAVTPDSSQPNLRERLLVILFNSYASKNEGLSSERLRYYCGVTNIELENTLAEMVEQGVVRKTRTGVWKYVRY